MNTNIKQKGFRKTREGRGDNLALFMTVCRLFAISGTLATHTVYMLKGNADTQITPIGQQF